MFRVWVQAQTKWFEKWDILGCGTVVLQNATTEH